MKRIYPIFLAFLCSFYQIAHGKKELNLLMLCYRFPALSETFVLGQIKGLLDANINVDIIAKRQGNTDTVHPIVTQYNLHERVRYLNFSEKKSTSLLINLINKKKYDIIYFQFEPLCIQIIDSIEQIMHKPLIITAVRGEDITAKYELDKEKYNKMYNIVDLVLPVCKFFKKQLIKTGCPANKIQVHHSAIDCQMFNYNSQDTSKKTLTKIGTVARLAQTKGLDSAIKAVAMLHEKNQDISYEIVGEGPLEDELKQLIEQLNAQSYIRLLGPCTATETAAFLNTLDLFVLPSISSEGIPNVLMEAMATGISTISTKVSGIPELLGSKNERGFLVKPGDVTALYKMLETITCSNMNLNELKVNARMYIEKEHNILIQNDKLVKKIKKFYVKKRNRNEHKDLSK